MDSPNVGESAPVATAPPPRIPLFSLSRKSPHRTDPAALEAYYANTSLRRRNVIFIGIVILGWSVVGTIVGPLMLLRMLQLGYGERYNGTVGSINLWAVSFLVMLFSWTSDHTISRLGRRKPYLFISAPFIIAAMMLFPPLAQPRWIILLIAIQMFALVFTDLKASTFSLIMIDCVPRAVLARTSAVLGIAGGITGFLVTRYAGGIIHSLGENTVFYMGGGLMTLTTLSAFLIKEPPIYYPPVERFKPWSTFKIAAADKRIFFLMIGVTMVNGFFTASGFVLWYWAKVTLNLSKEDIFQAISWAYLLNVALAYPLGWVIDRFGGLKVIVTYWVLAIFCFILAMHVHDKTGLVWLVLAQTLVAPLYGAGDIMIFKSCVHQDIGSITSTTSCIRNFYNGSFIFTLGMVISMAGHNYRLGFIIGIIGSTIGLIFFLIHHWLMRSSKPKPEAAVEVAGDVA